MNAKPFIDPAHEVLFVETLEEYGLSETDAKNLLEFTALLKGLVQGAKDRGVQQEAIAGVLYTAFLHESGQANPDRDQTLKDIKRIITGGVDN